MRRGAMRKQTWTAGRHAVRLRRTVNMAYQVRGGWLQATVAERAASHSTPLRRSASSMNGKTDDKGGDDIRQLPGHEYRQSHHLARQLLAVLNRDLGTARRTGTRATVSTRTFITTSTKALAGYNLWRGPTPPWACVRSEYHQVAGLTFR